MPRRRLIWKLYPACLAVMALSILAAGWVATRAVRGFYIQRTARTLEGQVNLIAQRLADQPLTAGDAALERLVRDLDRAAAARVTLIAPDGVVLADSQRDARTMENHAGRPEVQTALAGGTGTDTRFSASVQTEMMYVAKPLRRDGRTVAVVRVALALADLSAALRGIYGTIALVGLLTAIVASALGLEVFNRLIIRPLEQMQAAARRFADGELARPVPVPELAEFAALADALNRMARQLDEKIRTITRQSHEQQAVLSSMIEGVLAVDAAERIITLNQAAAALLRIDAAKALGRRLGEVVRNTQLQRFVARTLAGDKPVEADLVLPVAAPASPAPAGAAPLGLGPLGSEERFLQAHGTVLRDAGGASIGALVVLHDLTRLRRLENVRRDFVANVSHELKTPVTSIKGFIETLRDGALREPDKAEDFLAIVARQADRLNAIIDDLLKLSRIEQEGERGQVELVPHRLREVLTSAIHDCQGLAQERRITLALSCPAELTARLNAPLIEQAVVNLLDNAIKYSEPGSAVEIEARAEGDAARIDVRDRGPGIPAEHLPRLFERFYRVDKARSRKLGGTGLGLAIVKHIAAAHRGSASVQSTVGQGSTFTLHLPHPSPEPASPAP